MCSDHSLKFAIFADCTQLTPTCSQTSDRDEGGLDRSSEKVGKYLASCYVAGFINGHHHQHEGKRSQSEELEQYMEGRRTTAGLEDALDM